MITNTHPIERLIDAKVQTPFIEQALEKIIQDQIAQEEIELQRLQPRLAKYEDVYNMPSSKFFALYQNGEMGDEMDYFEWNVIYKMYLESNKRKKSLNQESDYN
ncbi:MAG: hypothetical protein U9Q82_04855 [Chloroflexota bacterium]|nr:hypothetical protein [Chloroflexota bacterium]